MRGKFFSEKKKRKKKRKKERTYIGELKAKAELLLEPLTLVMLILIVGLGVSKKETDRLGKLSAHKYCELRR